MNMNVCMNMHEYLCIYVPVYVLYGWMYGCIYIYVSRKSSLVHSVSTLIHSLVSIMRTVLFLFLVFVFSRCMPADLWTH